MSYLLIEPETIKQSLRLDPQQLKKSSLSIFKRRCYNAVLLHLTQSRIEPNAANEQQIEDYVHALFMLCDLGDFPRTKALLMLPVNETKTLHEYFGQLGCYLKQREIYEAVIDKFAAQIDLRFKAILLNSLGLANGYLGKTDKAILLHQEVLGIAQDLGDKNIEVKAYDGLARTYDLNLADVNKAKYLYEKMLRIATEINDLKYQALAILGKGSYEFNHFQYRESINLYNQALQIGKIIDDEELNIKIMSELAALYIHLGKKNKSLEILDLQLEKVRSRNDKRQEAVILSHYTQLYVILQDFDKSREYHRECYQIAQQINDVSLQILFLNNISVIHLRDKDFDRALEDLLALHQLIVTHHQTGITYAMCLLNLGYCYGCLKDFNQAITYAHKGLEIAIINNDKYLKASAMAVIANAHWQQKRYGHGIAFILYSLWIYPPWKHENMRFIFLEAVRSIRDLLREKFGKYLAVMRKF